MSPWAAGPVIVAEALVAVPDPLLTALRLPPVSMASGVAASLALSLAPDQADDIPPSWLLPEQHPSFRRAVAALRRYGGAILADPVGSGKTYVSLAVAGVCNAGRPTACLVPAALLRQWETAAAAVGIDVRLGSHEQASRGRVPAGTRGLVLIDESHHFRNRHTRRYAHVARWLVGRPALMVTATPVVNRLNDLAHQLRLAVRDDALSLEGVPSLGTLLANGCAVPALGRLVLETEVVPAARPRKASRISPPDKAECASVAQAVTRLGSFRLSNNPSVAALVRAVLLRAVSSSPAALAGTLRRYRRLLQHARDALASGRSVERSELRRFTSELGDQLVWWELLPGNDVGNDLELADLAEIEIQLGGAEAAARQPDTKLARLQELLSDEKPSVVFTCSRDTVRYIRERLPQLRLAWCTGVRAGIGSSTVARHDVLGWFRRDQSARAGPMHLIVTDVAAEGLDLQRAARVVHYDLPWTPMRLEQREGRAVRLGSSHREVEVVRFTPPPALERLLRMEATLRRKSQLPASAGLGATGRKIWRWRAELAAHFPSTQRIAGAAAVGSEKPGLLAGFVLYQSRHPATCLSTWVGWLEPGAEWCESPENITERLLSIAGSPSVPVREDRLQSCLGLLAGPIRERLGAIRGRYWIAREATPSVKRLTRRLHGLISDAARQRDTVRLRRLERALEFVSGGHTAGEAILIEQLAEDGQIEEGLSAWPPQRQGWDEIEVRLTGLIMFGE